jgi:hypothetical protein
MGDIAACFGTLLYVMIQEMSQNGTIGQVTGCVLDELGLTVGGEAQVFLFAKSPD